MPTLHTEQQQISTWQRLLNGARNELAPLGFGIVGSFVTGGLTAGAMTGFIAGYSALSGYMSAKNEHAGSRLTRMLGLSLTSTAAAVGLGEALGPAGLGIGTAAASVTASYINDGLAKIAVEATVGRVRSTPATAEKGEAPGHGQSSTQHHQEAQAQHQPAIIKPSVRARAAALGAKIFGRKAQHTIDTSLQARRTGEAKHSKLTPPGQ